MIIVCKHAPAWFFDGLNKEYMIADSQEQLEKLLDSATTLVTGCEYKLEKEQIDMAPKLKKVIVIGGGDSQIDLDYAKTKGIHIVSTNKLLAKAVAEHTVALALALAKNIVLGDMGMRRELWLQNAVESIDLSGSTFGIVGLGNVGSEVANLASSLGMNVIYTSRNKKPVVYEYVSLDQLLSVSDFVSLHVPLTPQTKNMITGNELSAMKESAYLINTSAGKLVDENALYYALKEKSIAGAAFDVFWEEPYFGELLKLPTFIATPHIAAKTPETSSKLWEFVLSELQRD